MKSNQSSQLFQSNHLFFPRLPEMLLLLKVKPFFLLHPLRTYPFTVGKGRSVQYESVSGKIDDGEDPGVEWIPSGGQSSSSRGSNLLSCPITVPGPHPHL